MESIKNVRKAKLLYLLDIFQRKTDAEKGLTITDIFDELYLRGITAERKSIYSDIAALREAGFKVEKRKCGDLVTYHLLGDNLSGRDLHDLSILVLSSPYLSKKKCNELVCKLSRQTTEQNGYRILEGMLKFLNDEEANRYLKVGEVVDAILDGKKIAFMYKGVKKIVSPYLFACLEGSLYLAAGSRRFEPGVDCFDFAYITDLAVLDRRASTLEEVTENPDFDLKAFVFACVSLPVGAELEMGFEVAEDELPNFMEEFESFGLVSDNGVEKNPAGFFRIQLTAKITPERIAYLHKNGEKINVLYPRCVQEKLLRIDKLIYSF